MRFLTISCHLCCVNVSYEEMPLPTEIDAQSYLISVKEHFKDDTGEFAQFIQILNDFRSKTCDAIGIITRLKQLVKSHELLLSFNKFLPKGFEILCPSKDCLRNKPRFQLKETLRYIRKIKTRFQDEEYIRKGFCILGKCSEVVDEFNEIISQSTNGIAGKNFKCLSSRKLPHGAFS
ncbi:paired amphipathic helix protein Sin3-like 3 [Cryptomeria japonica]|uniref:paired amphipathic helix protein Sin3-like 3 n=1 Tax=Cryptomeria japonica TaxID=3369 RepID=UPI0027DA2D08|nr:paired amphipathic helix protein Sin3-like 3 [Cryptomeria japonica]